MPRTKPETGYKIDFYLEIADEKWSYILHRVQHLPFIPAAGMYIAFNDDGPERVDDVLWSVPQNRFICRLVTREFETGYESENGPSVPIDEIIEGEKRCGWEETDNPPDFNEVGWGLEPI